MSAMIKMKKKRKKWRKGTNMIPEKNVVTYNFNEFMKIQQNFLVL